MTSKFSALLLVFLAITISLSADSQVQTYDSTATRNYLLHLKDNPIQTEVKVQGEFKSDKAKRFIDFYLENFVPKYKELSANVLKYYSLMLLSDSGSSQSEEELKSWQEELGQAAAVFNAHEVSEEWTEIVREAVRLADGLEGDLPDSIRNTLEERELESFPPAMKPKLDEIDRLSKEFDVAINQAKANENLSQVLQETRAASRRFKAGEITFEQATEIIRKNNEIGGYRFIAYEAVQKHPNHLNQVAVLRSKLAPSKGYKTWAEYRLSNDKGYSEVYRGVEKQKEFLTGLIQNLAPKVRTLLEARIKELKKNPNEIVQQYVGLVLPPALEQLIPYFPPEKITEIWQKTILESGFTPEALSQILVDAEVRKGKNSTGAYMAGVIAPYVSTELIDAQTLSYITPAPDSELWNRGFSYILQSYKTGGVSDLDTMFHEGGHALEKVLKFKNKDLPEGYGYVETPSMTMEHFTNDPEVLFDKAVPIDGKKPSVQEIKVMIENAHLAKAYGLLHSASMSLFDIELWDYDYSQPGAMTFLERVKYLDDQLSVMTKDFADLDSSIESYYHLLSTGHFTSGAVRNIGYVFAEMASLQMAEFISDEMEKTTGRRSWFKQPSLGKLFAERFFAQGWKLPFPENIEKITGKSYDPEKIVEDFMKPLMVQKKNCEDQLDLPKD